MDAEIHSRYSSIYELLNGFMPKSIILTDAKRGYDASVIKYEHIINNTTNLTEFYKICDNMLSSNINIIIHKNLKYLIYYAVLKYSDSILIYDTNVQTIYEYFSNLVPMQHNFIKSLNVIRKLCVLYILINIIFKSENSEWRITDAFDTIKSYDKDLYEYINFKVVFSCMQKAYSKELNKIKKFNITDMNIEKVKEIMKFPSSGVISKGNFTINDIYNIIEVMKQHKDININIKEIYCLC